MNASEFVTKRDLIREEGEEMEKVITEVARSQVMFEPDTPELWKNFGLELGKKLKERWPGIGPVRVTRKGDPDGTGRAGFSVEVPMMMVRKFHGEITSKGEVRL